MPCQASSVCLPLINPATRNETDRNQVGYAVLRFLSWSQHPLGSERGPRRGWMPLAMPSKHSEWTILTGFIPIALAAAIVEIVVDPELVDLLVGDLGRGLGFAGGFVQELLVMSTLTVC